MPRRRHNLPLWLRLLVRRLRSPEGKLAPLAVISIAVSVTLATGLEMASRSAQRHLEVSAEAIVGSAEIEISAGDVGVAEEILDVVRATPGVRAASPLVSLRLRLVDQNFALNLVGVDLVAEEMVRGTAIERNGLQIRDPLRLLAAPNSVVVTETLLDRLGLGTAYREGGSAEIRVDAEGREKNLIVQGVLRATGIAAAYSGQVALMDVYAAQMLGGRTGLFDRIDVVADQGQDVAALMIALESQLDGVATVQRSSARSGVAQDLLEMVRRSALLLAGAAALVACLLTYATTSQWVERQSRQFATLRAVGMEARRVQQMIFIDVTMLAFAGTALGLAGGIAISPPLLSTLSRFLRVVLTQEFQGVSLQSSTLWVAAAVGLVASAAGSTLPARRAATRFTLDALEVHTTRRPATGISFWVGASAAAVFVVVSTAGKEAILGGAMIRVAVLLLLGIVATLAFAPLILGLLRPALRLIEAHSPAIGHLATGFFRLRPRTFAVTLSAISTLVGVLITVFLLIATIGSAFERWAESRFPGGPTLILPQPLSDPIMSILLSSKTLQAIRSTAGIAAVNERYGAHASILFRGQEVPLIASSMDAILTHGHLPSVGRASADLARDLKNGGIAVSPGFQQAFGLTVGDKLELDTHHGSREFTIVGIFEDFGEDFGSIQLDLTTFDANWKRSGASSAVVWIDGPTEPVITEIRDRVGSGQDLYFVGTQEIVAANRALTEVFTSTLHVLGAFISLLGAIGVMILLAGIVAERRRDLAVLRAAGAEPRQLVLVVLADALTLGVLGAACGLVLGLACAVPASDILRETYGWILEQRWTADELPWVVAGAVTAALVGALLPARIAYLTNADDVFGPE